MKKAERKHLERVASLGCIACRILGFAGTPAECHHIREGVGASQRAGHDETIPLCPVHHRSGDAKPNADYSSIHKTPKLFIERFGTERELLRMTFELLAEEQGMTTGRV